MTAQERAHAAHAARRARWRKRYPHLAERWRQRRERIRPRHEIDGANEILARYQEIGHASPETIPLAAISEPPRPRGRWSERLHTPPRLVTVTPEMARAWLHDDDIDLGRDCTVRYARLMLAGRWVNSGCIIFSADGARVEEGITRLRAAIIADTPLKTWVARKRPREEMRRLQRPGPLPPTPPHEIERRRRERRRARRPEVLRQRRERRAARQAQ